MIFITVGTHEDQFDRLLKEIDELVGKNEISNNVYIQRGYSKYQLKNIDSKDMISYDEMNSLYDKADIIITHGGPGSIFGAISRRKIPIVVPRNPYYGEHVDDHQIKFCRHMERNKKVIAVYDIKDLKDSIINYYKKSEEINVTIENNKKKFIEKLNDYIESISK